MIFNQMSNILEDPDYYAVPEEEAAAEFARIGKWVEVVIIFELFIVGPLLDICGRRKIIIPTQMLCGISLFLMPIKIGRKFGIN